MAEPAWGHELLREPGGSFRLEVLDEDQVRYPVARQLTEPQARFLLKQIATEAATSGRPIKAVIRDYHFMAATILMVKRDA